MLDASLRIKASKKIIERRGNNDLAIVIKDNMIKANPAKKNIWEIEPRDLYSLFLVSINLSALNFIDNLNPFKDNIFQSIW